MLTWFFDLNNVYNEKGPRRARQRGSSQQKLARRRAVPRLQMKGNGPKKGLISTKSHLQFYFAFTPCRNNELSYKNMFFFQPELADYCLWLCLGLCSTDASLLSHRDKHDCLSGLMFACSAQCLSAVDAEGGILGSCGWGNKKMRCSESDQWNSGKSDRPVDVLSTQFLFWS